MKGREFYAGTWGIAAIVASLYELRGSVGIAAYVFSVILAVKLARCIESKIWSSVVMVAGVGLPYLILLILLILLTLSEMDF